MMGHELPHRRGHRVGGQCVLDSAHAVARIGPFECSYWPQSALTGDRPPREICHSRQCDWLDVRQHLQSVGTCRQQRAEDAGALALEFRPEFFFCTALAIWHSIERQVQRAVGKVGSLDSVHDPVHHNRPLRPK
jgi:hypothetical protein